MSYESHLSLRIIKFWCRFEKRTQKFGKIFRFSDKSIWIVRIESFLLRRENLPSAVNVLTKSLKTLHVTKSNFFQLNYLYSDQWIWYRCSRWDWIKVSACLPCCLSRCRLKRVFLDIYLTTSFRVRNFVNT